LVNRRGPAFLKARALAVREGEGVNACREHIEQVRPARSVGILAHHMGQCLAIAALRHGKQGAKDRLQSRVLKGLREIGSRRSFSRMQQMKTSVAKMRQQEANAARRE